jgi:hypothetical protein
LIIPSTVQSATFGIGEVKGDRSSTSSLVPYTAASSIGILPHCQVKEEVYSEAINTEDKKDKKMVPWHRMMQHHQKNVQQSKWFRMQLVVLIRYS